MTGSDPLPLRRAAITLAALALGLASAVGPAAAQQNDESAPPAAEERPATPAQQMARWFHQAAEAYAAEDHERWVEALENLHRMRPFNYDFMRQLVMGYALTGQTARAFDMMLRMQQQGLAEDWDAIEEVEPLRQYPLYEHLRDLMKQAGEPGGAAQPVWTIDAEHAMPEALAHDADSGRVFVGTVRDGRILVRGSDDAEFKLFASPEDTPGLMGVFDLLVDEERGHLWVATASAGPYRGVSPSNQGRTALLRLDLDSGEKLGEYRVLADGVPHMLGAMAQADDGTLYAADGAAPVIYRWQPGDERPRPFVVNPSFTSLRGIALSPDESKLYVADYELGLFFFELGEQVRGFAIGVPDSLNLGGIDGLYEWDGHLVAIQNGVTPQRVLRLKLDESGTRVASIATVAKALPEFDNPTWGTMAGDSLLFLAASHWHRVGPDGRPVDPPLPDVPLMRTRIDRAQSVVLGEEMLEEFKRRQEGALRDDESN
jgi:sugar lactone lactonase YvrE